MEGCGKIARDERHGGARDQRQACHWRNRNFRALYYPRERALSIAREAKPCCRRSACVAAWGGACFAARFRFAEAHAHIEVTKRKRSGRAGVTTLADSQCNCEHASVYSHQAMAFSVLQAATEYISLVKPPGLVARR